MRTTNVMTLIGLLVLLVCIGVVLAVVPMDGRIRTVIGIVVALVVVVWLLSYFGGWNFGSPPRHHWR